MKNETKYFREKSKAMQKFQNCDHYLWSLSRLNVKIYDLQLNFGPDAE